MDLINNHNVFFEKIEKYISDIYFFSEFDLQFSYNYIYNYLLDLEKDKFPELRYILSLFYEEFIERVKKNIYNNN